MMERKKNLMLILIQATDLFFNRINLMRGKIKQNENY